MLNFNVSFHLMLSSLKCRRTNFNAKNCNLNQIFFFTIYIKSNHLIIKCNSSSNLIKPNKRITAGSFCHTFFFNQSYSTNIFTRYIIEFEFLRKSQRVYYYLSSKKSIISFIKEKNLCNEGKIIIKFFTNILEIFLFFLLVSKIFET